MSTANPFFLYPFASDPSATATTVDSTGASTGPLSYQFGFTPNYEADLSTAPTALPIPRPQFNQLMLDITSALQQLQLQGAPLWVAPATGSPPVGGPASYPIYSRVSYDPGAPYGMQIWESQIGGNMSVPGADNNWVVISGGRAIAVGDYIDSASPNGREGALLCDGADYLRTDYPLLVLSLTITQSCVTNSTITVTVPDTSKLSAYLSGTTQKCFVEGSNIPSGAYIVGVTPTTITLSAAATSSGTFDLTFWLYGNGDGSTTFNVPNCLRRVNMASGGSGNSVIGNKIANQGGDDTYMQQLTDIFPHKHNVDSNKTVIATNQTTQQAGSAYNAVQIAALQTDYVPAQGTQTAMNIIQSANISFRYIKY